jgi:hypothetical protein
MVNIFKWLNQKLNLVQDLPDDFYPACRDYPPICRLEGGHMAQPLFTADTTAEAVQYQEDMSAKEQEDGWKIEEIPLCDQKATHLAHIDLAIEKAKADRLFHAEQAQTIGLLIRNLYMDRLKINNSYNQRINEKFGVLHRDAEVEGYARLPGGIEVNLRDGDQDGMGFNSP